MAENKQEVAGYISSSYTCNNSPKYGCHTEAGRVEAKRLGGCELHPEPVSPEWIAEAVNEAADEMGWRHAGMCGFKMQPCERCRNSAIIQAAIERNSK